MTSADFRIHTLNFSEILYRDKTKNKMQENKKFGIFFINLRSHCGYAQDGGIVQLMLIAFEKIPIVI